MTRVTRLAEIRPLGDCLLWEVMYLKITEVALIFALLFSHC
jgi:hypothetical protein